MRLHDLIIDAETMVANNIIQPLSEREDVTWINPVVQEYRQDPSLCQIRLTSEMSADQLDFLLWNKQYGFGYIGVVECAQSYFDLG
tara:strand:- start:8189 stop:8446 length:258 start_codon:yes stop_codon:yes gene_type:complete